jgi:tRNA 5-methylaminomethyl-2-thiouridine biosynthesis bifunctional protein
MGYEAAVNDIPPEAATETEPLLWGEDGLPRSALYGDVYFSSDDGLAESRAVFLAGCGLPEAWGGRRQFTVAELGFGTGLNIAALLDLWSRERPEGARLSIFSLEAHPIGAEAARRALSRWPELGEPARLLLERWPGRARGFHRVDLPEFNAILDLAVMPAEEALKGWSGKADAWFLDGFSPATNPAMWSEDLMALVAARSAPGARAATFTVAGAVRRSLSAAGFAVEKAPGFGRKRERLEARAPGAPAAESAPPAAAIIGGGIAGASLARALRGLGLKATVYDAKGPGAGASGNPAGLVTPRLDAGLGAPARLFAQAYARAVRLYEDETPGAIIARGSLQLEIQPRDAGRFAKVAAADLFEPGALGLLDADETSGRLGEPVAGAIHYRDALVLAPADVLPVWCGDTVLAEVSALEPRKGGGWRLLDPTGALLGEADVVFLASGPAATCLAPALPLSPVRGQVSWTTAERGAVSVAFGGYAIPTRSGLLFGATHDREDAGAEVRPGDNARNLQTLAKGLPVLAARLAGAPLQARAGVRAATPDRLPLAGPVPGALGLYVLSGLGARGFTLAPLLAEHLAAMAAGAPSPLPADLAALIDPARYAGKA